MYFPPLSNLRKKQVNNHDIELLDWWLGTRRANTRKYLNPLQFSLDCRIDADYALKLFSLCALDESIDLLSVRYVSRCPNCNTVVSKQEHNFIPSINRCFECGFSLGTDMLKDGVEVYFSLKQSPQDNVLIDNILGADSGNAPSLQGANVRASASNDNDLCGLFSCFM